jgi:hypothetical protein
VDATVIVAAEAAEGTAAEGIAIAVVAATGAAIGSTAEAAAIDDRRERSSSRSLRRETAARIRSALRACLMRFPSASGTKRT